MKSHFFQNGFLRGLLLSAYRQWARLQFYRTGPRVLINSIPKAGTHLLIAEMMKFSELMNSRLHFDTVDVIKADHEHRPFGITDADIDLAAIQRKIDQVRHGQFFTAHIAYTRAISDLLATNHIKVINLVRDPRDVMVSNYYYLKGLRRHRIHDYFVGLESDYARYLAILEGRESSPRMIPHASVLNEYVGWTKDPRVLTVSFEELIGERGGGRDSEKEEALARIRKHVGLPPLAIAAFEGSKGTTSVTFRKGAIGSWRNELTPEVIALFEQLCGPVTRQLGYEQECGAREKVNKQ